MRSRRLPGGQATLHQLETIRRPGNPGPTDLGVHAGSKIHVVRGRDEFGRSAPFFILIVSVIAALTAAAYFLNAVFAFAIVNERIRRSDPDLIKRDAIF